MKIEKLRRALMDYHINLERLKEYDQIIHDIPGKMSVSYGIDSIMPKGSGGSSFTTAERYAIQVEAIERPRNRLLEKVAVIEEAEMYFYVHPDKFSILAAYTNKNQSIRQYALEHGMTHWKARKQFDNETALLHSIMFG